MLILVVLRTESEIQKLINLDGLRLDLHVLF